MSLNKLMISVLLVSAFKKILSVLVVATSLALCTSSSTHEKKLHTSSPKNDPVDTFKPAFPTSDTQFVLNYRNVFNVNVILKYPKKSNGKNILLLHGFNLPAMQWCEKTSFCTQALDSGYTLIIPDFNKTTYQYIIYKETIPKYRIYPTRQWMLDTLFPHLQNQFGLLLPDTSSFVAGISTGGRGAVLLGHDRPQIFRALASLSGDFDQTEMQGEPIYTGYYGPYATFTSRWTNEDNPMRWVKNWTVPCFLAHGGADKVSPQSQTEMFSRALKKQRPRVKQYTLFPPQSGHTYSFWGACSQPMLRFFSQVSR